MTNLKLAYLRCIRGGTGLGAVVFSIALLQATFVITAAVIPLVESQAVKQQIEGLSSSDRWFSINLGDSTQLGSQEKNNFGISTLESLGGRDPVHFILYRPISNNTAGRFQLFGTNKLSEQIELTSGRLPEKCSESLCEVLLINSQERSVPSNFQIVGTATLKTDSPILPSLDPSSPWLLSSDIASVAKLTMFSGFPGTETWSSEITYGEIQKIGLSNFLDRANQAVSNLSRSSGRMQLIAPLTLLDRTQAQVEVMLKRVLSLELSLCLVGSFAIFLLSRSGRNKHEQFLNAANRIQPIIISRLRITVATSVVICLLGNVIGILLGWFATNLLAKTLGFPQIDWAATISIVLSSALLILAGLSKSRLHIGITFLLAASTWLAFIYTNNLQPQLAAIAVAASLVSYLIIQASNRLVKNRFVKSVYLSNQSWIVAVTMTGAFLVSIIVSGITSIHSLELNAIDSAVFNSPTLTRVKMGGDAQVLQFNSLNDYRTITNGSDVYPIRKIQGTIQSGSTMASPIQLMGIDSKLWQSVPDIRHQTGLDLRKASSLLSGPNIDYGIATAGATQIRVQASGLDKNTFLSAWVLNQQSESTLVNFSIVDGGFFAHLPLHASRLLGFEISEDPDYTARREHAVGEGKNSLPVPHGTIIINSLLLDQQPAATPVQISQDYNVINGPVYFSLVDAPQSIETIVDMETAKHSKANQIQIQITPDTSVVLNVTGISKNMPTVPMKFALIDAQPLTQFLASKNPELLRIPEVWIAGNVENSPEARKKLTGLTVISQDQLSGANLSQVNALWTKRSFGLFAISGLTMFLALLIFAARNIYSNQEIFGWTASGKKLSTLYSRLTQNLTLSIVISMLTSLVVTITLLPTYIANSRFDIKGELAYPPLVTQWNWMLIVEVITALGALSLVVLIFTGRYIAKSSEESQ